VRKLVLKSGDAGRAKLTVKARGDGLSIAGLPPALPVRAQLGSTTGVCWEGEFRPEGVTRSTPSTFAAKVSLGSPSGAFVDTAA
jgi:hypothetical protein